MPIRRSARLGPIIGVLGLMLSGVAHAASVSVPIEVPTPAPMPSAGAKPQYKPLPAELQGSWVIRSATGEQPLLLETKTIHDLVGRRVTVGKHLQLWDIFDGTVIGFAETKGTLLDYLKVKSGEAPTDLPDGDRTFVFYEIGVSDCTSHGKRLQGGCFSFTLARDPANGEVGLVTYPGGLALFGPPSPPKTR